MASFDTLHAEAHRRGNIRKAVRTAAYLGRRSEVAPPESMFTNADGEVEIVDLKEAGFSPIGLVTVDGFNFEREDSNSEVQSQGFLSPTREDLESSNRTVTFTMQEVMKKANKEFLNGTRYDDAVFTEGDSELVLRNPEFPQHEEWCLVVVAIDGPSGNEHLDAKVLPTIKVQTVGGEQFGGDTERNREVTARVYVDDELGVPEIDIIGGHAFARTAEDLGWADSADNGDDSDAEGN